MIIFIWVQVRPTDRQEISNNLIIIVLKRKMEILIVKLIFMSNMFFNLLVGTEEMTIDELTDELQFVETDLSLFTGESVVKEKLIVREILELKRSVFLLKAMVNNTSKTSRGKN